MKNLYLNLGSESPKVMFRYLDRSTELIHNGHKLYRIMYNFDLSGDEYVGGWVENINNIKDNAIIFNEAKVYEDAKVSGNAKVMDNAIIRGVSIVTDYSCIKDNALIEGKSLINSNSTVKDMAVIRDSTISGATICDQAHIYNESYISGYSTVHDCYINNSRLESAVLVVGSPASIMNSKLIGNVTVGCENEDYKKEVIIDNSYLDGPISIRNIVVENVNIKGNVALNEKKYYLRFSDIGSRFNSLPNIVYCKSKNKYFRRGIEYTPFQLIKTLSKCYGIKGFLFSISLFLYKKTLTFKYGKKYEEE